MSTWQILIENIGTCFPHDLAEPMNHLGHFLLAHPDKQLMAGGFLGDFVKGRLKGEFQPEVERGIQLHRAIDAFADRHPMQRQSCQRFDTEFRRFGSIMCDVIYDHFLALHWDTHGVDKLDLFSEAAYDAVLDNADTFPAEVIEVIRGMKSHGTLERYRSETYIDRALCHISGRLRVANPLMDAFSQFHQHQFELEADFHQFIQDARIFANTWQEQASA